MPIPRFPMLKMRKVGANLSTGDYLKTIASQTDDISVNIVFNNAGYMLTGASPAAARCAGDRGE